MTVGERAMAERRHYTRMNGKHRTYPPDLFHRPTILCSYFAVLLILITALLQTPDVSETALSYAYIRPLQMRRSYEVRPRMPVKAGPQVTGCHDVLFRNTPCTAVLTLN